MLFFPTSYVCIICISFRPQKAPVYYKYPEILCLYILSSHLLLFRKPVGIHMYVLIYQQPYEEVTMHWK